MKLYSYQKAVILQGLNLESKIITQGKSIKERLVTKRGTFTNVFIQTLTDDSMGILSDQGIFHFDIADIIELV